MQADITVAYVNYPKPGKKRGSVKDTNNVVYGAFADTLSQLKQGGVYRIEYSEDDFNNQKWKTIRGVQMLQAPPPQAQGSQQPNRGGGNTYRETSAKDSERMYVTALARAFIQSGQIAANVKAVVDLTNALREAYRQTYGGATQPAAPAQQPVQQQQRLPVGQQYDADLDDHIPF